MRFSTISAIHLLIAGIALGAPLEQTLKRCNSKTGECKDINARPTLSAAAVPSGYPHGDFEVRQSHSKEGKEFAFHTMVARGIDDEVTAEADDDEDADNSIEARDTNKKGKPGKSNQPGKSQGGKRDEQGLTEQADN